ncbi:hypothetical protein LSCM1_02031 [Leishmania martiniquensis]|uniref:Transmembrane protein 18 n=1 Tax=Leishmania martiniquensis TaxID=1580590 RepID=A0A836KEC5_9TRYP|nr:hypothetical protein LSCM1_02031 [Leishmania martiniquensis]
MPYLESLHAWLGRVEDELWRAHDEFLNVTGARAFLDAASTSSFSMRSISDRFLEDIFNFYTAVNWSEPFFRYLCAFHIVVWVTAIAATWGAVSDERITGVCVMVGVLLLAGIPANAYAGRHAEWIFREPGVNYFTEDGTMLMVLYAVPMLALMVCLQLRQVCRVVWLMVQLHRAKLRLQLRKQARREGHGDADGGDNAGDSKKTQ